MTYTDKTLTCVDCQAPFTFSARDQEFHATKGFENEPKRCPACRQSRRQQRGEAPAAAGAARRGSQPVYSGPRAQSRPSGSHGGAGRTRGPRRDFGRGARNSDHDAGAGGPRSFGGAVSEGPRSYTASCMACGEDTEVAADSGNRVIFCRDCYTKMTAMASS